MQALNGKSQTAPSPATAPSPDGRQTSADIAQLAYELTLRFCDRYVDPRSPVYEALLQAARRSTPEAASPATVPAKRAAAIRSGLNDMRTEYAAFLQGCGGIVWPATDSRREHLLAQHYTTIGAVTAWIQRQHQALLLRAVAHHRLAHGTRGANIVEAAAADGAAYPELMANTALVLVDLAARLLDAETK